jgi:hypothetical protein
VVVVMLAAALDLAAQGWAVFPCKWQGDDAKAPLTINGHHDASRDPDVIRAWWTRWPQAMIGAPVPDPFIVVDVDPRNNSEGLTELENLVGPIPSTLTVWSGRRDGGRHLYFQRPAGPVTSTKLPEGIDLKAAGYCVVPPSIHPASGAPYAWIHRPAATMPVRLRELLRPPPPRRWTGGRKSGDGHSLVAWVASQTEGNRGEGLFWAACRAAENGQLHNLADDLIRAAVSTGLTEIEARRAVNSASRRIEAHA